MLDSAPWQPQVTETPLLKTNLVLDNGVSLTVLTDDPPPEINLGEQLTFAVTGFIEPYNVRSFKHLSTGEIWCRWSSLVIALLAGFIFAVMAWFFSRAAVSALVWIGYGFYIIAFGCFFLAFTGYFSYRKIKAFEVLFKSSESL